MSEQIHIRPRRGLRVRDPDAGYVPLPAGGAWVRNTRYWRRALAVGDVEAVPRTAKKGKARTPTSNDED